MDRARLELRPARETDLPVIVSWIPDADACLRWAGPRIRFPLVPEVLAQELFEADRTSRCLIDPGDPDRPLAFGQHWERAPGNRHLGRVVVDPSHRGFGLGHALVTRLVDEARAIDGTDWITLRVFADNRPALAVYRQAGFVDVPALREDDAIFMRRPAAP